MLEIKKYREKMHWKQSELAKKIGIATSTVGMWEIGKRKPDIITLKKLACLFNCTTDELLDSTDFEKSKQKGKLK